MPSLVLKVGDRFDVVLEGRGSAGYGWTASVDPCAECIRIESQAAEEPPRAIPGGPPPDSASLKILFTITALAPGTAIARFRLRRPWEQDVPPLEERTFDVTIR